MYFSITVMHYTIENQASARPVREKSEYFFRREEWLNKALETLFFGPANGAYLRRPIAGT